MWRQPTHPGPQHPSRFTERPPGHRAGRPLCWLYAEYELELRPARPALAGRHVRADRRARRMAVPFARVGELLAADAVGSRSRLRPFRERTARAPRQRSAYEHTF